MSNRPRQPSFVGMCVRERKNYTKITPPLANRMSAKGGRPSSRPLRQTLCALCVETMRIQGDRIAGESRGAGRRPLPPIGVDLSRRVEDATPYLPRTRHNAPSTMHQATKH